MAPPPCEGDGAWAQEPGKRGDRRRPRGDSFSSICARAQLTASKQASPPDAVKLVTRDDRAERERHRQVSLLRITELDLRDAEFHPFDRGMAVLVDAGRRADDEAGAAVAGDQGP